MPGCAAYGTSRRTDRGCSPRSCVTGISNRLGGPGLPRSSGTRRTRPSEVVAAPTGAQGWAHRALRPPWYCRPPAPARTATPLRCLCRPLRAATHASEAQKGPPASPVPTSACGACAPVRRLIGPSDGPPSGPSAPGLPRRRSGVRGAPHHPAVSAHVGPSPRCLRPQPTATPLLGLCGDSAGAVSPASGTVCPCGRQGQRPPISTRTGVRKAPDDAGRGNGRWARQPLGASGQEPRPRSLASVLAPAGEKSASAYRPRTRGPGDAGGPGRQAGPPPQPQGQLGPATPWLWARGLRSRDRTSVCCLKTSSCGRLLRGPRDLGTRRPATCGRPGGPPRGAWRPAGTPVPASESHPATIVNL